MKIPPVRLITSGQDSCTEARSDRNINTNSAVCQNNFLQFSLCISQFCACRKCCTDSAVNATAVSIDLRPGWLSSIDKAGLTTQPLPRVNNPTIAQGMKRHGRMHLYQIQTPGSSFQPLQAHFSSPSSQSLFTKEQAPLFTCYLYLRCLPEDRRNHLLQGTWFPSVAPASATQLQSPGPSSPVLGLPSWVGIWPPTGRTGKSCSCFLLSYAGMKCFRSFTKYPKVFMVYPVQQDPHPHLASKQ